MDPNVKEVGYSEEDIKKLRSFNLPRFYIFSLVFVGLAMFGLGIIVGNYFSLSNLVQREQTANQPITQVSPTIPVETQELPALDTGSWKSITNKKYNFSVLYPYDKKSLVQSNIKTPIANETYVCRSNKVSGETAEVIYLASDDKAIQSVKDGIGTEFFGDLAISVSVVNNNQNLSTKDWIKTYCIRDTATIKDYNEISTSVANKSAIQISGSGFGKFIYTIFSVNNKVYLIEGSIVKNTPENIALYNNIISTFKFTK